MRVRVVIYHQHRNDAQTAAMRLAHQISEVAHRSVGRVDAAVIGDVVAVVAQRRRIEGEEPECGDSEILNIVELFDEFAKVAYAVVVRIEERLHVNLIDDGVLVPERIVGKHVDRKSTRLNYSN